MKRSLKWAVCAGGLLGLCGAFVTGQSWADGIPTTGALAYSGRLEAPNGDPLTGSRNLELKFWNAASGGSTPLCTTSSQSTTLDQGRFTLNLPDACTDAIGANPDVWIEILVDGSSLGRTKTGAVPYAVEASHATASDVAASAEALGTLAPSDVQRRVTGNCSNANQAIKTIAADGTVTCETDVQRRTNALSTQCQGANQSIKTISETSAVTCETDNDTTYTPGTGITVSATNTIGIASNGVTRTHLSGTEVQVYEQAAGCGGGLTTSTTCNTIPCQHQSGIDLLNFYNCARSSCTSAAPSTCANLTPAGWLVAP